MKKFHVLTTALAAAAFLAGCGGNDAGDQSPRVAFTQMVNFGDSLSDVGTYKSASSRCRAAATTRSTAWAPPACCYINWTEFLAATLQLPQPCAAETGLNTSRPVVPSVAAGRRHVPRHQRHAPA